MIASMDNVQITLAIDQERTVAATGRIARLAAADLEPYILVIIDVHEADR
jgi:hypothetical protein